MASTDTGHEGMSFDYAYQPEALLDYAYRGVHLATQFAKAAIESYYDRGIDYSYLKGCSNGGRAALLEATRFPNDYDGIIAGAPVFRFQEFMPWAIAAAKKQSDGPLTEASLKLLDSNSSSACDLLDGELVIRFIFIECFNYPVPPYMLITVAVILISICICISRCLEPAYGHVLPVAG